MIGKTNAAALMYGHKFYRIDIKLNMVRHVNILLVFFAIDMT